MKLYSPPSHTALLALATQALFGISLHALERVNLDFLGNPPTGGVSWTPSASADGRFVVFATNSTLIPADTNGDFDIYLRDRTLGTTTCISLDMDGNPAGKSTEPSISADGNFVVFESYSSALVPGDTNGEADLFVRDLSAGTTTRVSVATGGAQSAGPTYGPASLSGDGRLVVFASHSDDLVPGDTNMATDVFLHDRSTGTTTRLSVGHDASEGDVDSEGPVISTDGSTVVFMSEASNLTVPPTDGTRHVFAHDLDSGESTLVSRNSGGDSGDGVSGSYLYAAAITPDGRYVAFQSEAGNLAPGGDLNGDPDIFVHDRLTGTTELVSVASDGTKQNDSAFNPAISPDGRLVAFTSGANNLVSPGGTFVNDLFVHDRASGETHLITVNHDGTATTDESWERAVFVENGNAIVFESSAPNLLPTPIETAHNIFYYALPFVHADSFQPDLLLGLNANIDNALGDGIYQANAAAQTLGLNSRRARPVTAHVFFRNDGDATDDFRVRGQTGNRFFDIRYFEGAANRTGAVSRGNHPSGKLAPGEHHQLRVVVVPSRRDLRQVRQNRRGQRRVVWLSRTCNATITAISQSDPAALDRGRIRVQHR